MTKTIKEIPLLERMRAAGIPVTMEEKAEAYGTVTCPDGSVWVRCVPKERLTAEDLELKQHLHEIPVAFEVD